MLADHRINEGVYVLGYTYTRPSDGARYFYRFWTGFAAHYTGVVWTNAHCVDAALEIAQELNQVRGANPYLYIVQSGTPVNGNQTYGIDLDRYWKHPDYDDTAASEDIGMLGIAGELPYLMDILPLRFADDLSVGQPIGTSGFPGERSATGGDAYLRATPTFKAGIVSACRRTPHVAALETPSFTHLVS